MGNRLNVDTEVSEAYSKEQRIDYKVLKFADKKIIEEGCIRQIGEELSDLIKGSPGVNFCIDFSGVEFVSAEGFGKLISADKKLTQRGNKSLGFRRVSPAIYELLSITHLDRLFDIDQDSKAAYDSHVKASIEYREAQGRL